MQVDGEPWKQPPGDIVVLKSALKVSSNKHAYFLYFGGGRILARGRTLHKKREFIFAQFFSYFFVQKIWKGTLSPTAFFAATERRRRLFVRL